MNGVTKVRRLLLIPITAAALLAAGCGGSDDETSATTDWADDVCSAMTEWSMSIESAADSLKGGNLSRNGLEAAVEDIKSATDTFVTDVRDVGRPDTDAGQQAKESLDQLADDVEQNMAKIESAVDDASDVSGVLTAVSVASATLVTMGDQISSTVEGLAELDARGELTEAFERADACADLRTSRS
jgi:ABC-type transporter Mla subunit MlaD